MIINQDKSQSGIRKHTLKREITFGPLSLRFITIIIIAALCILYLAQSTQGATKNYELRELEYRQAELEKENERLGVEATRLQALQVIDDNLEKQKKEQKEDESQNQDNSETPKENLISGETPEYIE